MADDSNQSNFLASRLIAGFLALLAWLGLLAQIGALIQMAHDHGWSLGQLLSGFFSYFTNLTNLLVAFLLTQHVFRGQRPIANRLAISTDAAAVVWIATVGAVNEWMLRGAHPPHGLLLLADILCHNVMPIAYPLYWILLVPKTRLPWGDALRWLIYPVAFAIISLIRGRLTHWYPYPFFNADKLGLWNVVLILAYLGAALTVAGTVTIAIDRQLSDGRLRGGPE